ncbi:MAG: hypothetical protein HY756_10570 [Nitrospirae bacterium]|nr:hypothetical protein [Nitrospirota bacterium]
MKKLPWVIAIIFLLALSIVIVTTIILVKKKEAPKGEFKDMANATFVGSGECRKCHERIYSNWKGTLHARMMVDAKKDPSAVLGDFDSATSPKSFKKEDILYTIGSQWRQRYLTKTGDDYFVLPAQFNVSAGRWEETPEDKGWKDRPWFKDCAGCHATGVEPAKKTFKEAGVGCESCHGPGSNHAKATLGYEIFTIINPAKLTTKAAADICGSCHSSGTDKSGEYTYPVNYRVTLGSNLRLFFKMSSPEKNPDKFWSSKDSKMHHQQYIDWERSEHSKVGVACFTCHSVHEKETLFQTKQAGDELCKGCHKPLQLEAKASHTIHTFGSCISCHMPKTVKEGVYAGEERSHSFKFIGPDESFKHDGVKNQPNSCSGCHHHKDTPLVELMGAWSAVKQRGIPRPVEPQKEVR